MQSRAGGHGGHAASAASLQSDSESESLWSKIDSENESESSQSHLPDNGSGGAGHSSHSTSFEQFRNMQDRCHICQKCVTTSDPGSTKPTYGVFTCRCGVQCCRSCTGVAKNARGAVLADSAYSCDQCLKSFAVSNPGKLLLTPAPSVVICGQCGCDTLSEFYCDVPARCSSCLRPFCSNCSAQTLEDLKNSNSPKIGRALENKRKVVLMQCMPCVGREAYADGRRRVLNTLIKRISGTSMKLDEIPDAALQSSLSKNKEATHTFGDLMFSLRFVGLRALHAEFLPYLKNLAEKQIHFKLTVSISPFHMLLYSSQSSSLDGSMLESICRAHAEAAMEAGNLLLKRFPLEPGQRRHGAGDAVTKMVVVFYAPDLLKQGPRINLAGESIRAFAEDSRYDTWICANGPADLAYPPVRDLHDLFRNRNRLLLFDPDAEPAVKLQLLLEVQLDAVFSFPGWTWGDMADILYALANHNKLIFNTIGFAGLMHFPEAITATLVGPAIGYSQMKSSKREPVAKYALGDTYQPSQSHPHLNQQPTESSRSKWNLPEKPAFIAVCTMSLDRLEAESMVFFIEFLQRTPSGFILLLERPAAMRGQVEEWIDNQLSAATVGLKSRFIFRKCFPDSPGLYELLALADASLDSVGGKYSAHTTAQDALMHVPHFCTNDPHGLMQSRVGAEITFAAGLGCVCVGQTGQETIDLLVRYASDSNAQRKTLAFIAENRRDKKGLFCTERTPRAWKAVLEHYRDTTKVGTDFDIPLHSRAVKYTDDDATFVTEQSEPATTCAATADGNLVSIVRQLNSNTDSDMQPVLSDMMREIQSESGVQFLRLEGSGTFMNTVRCQTEAGELVALKISKKGRPADRMHNDPALRHSCNSIVWHRRTRNSEIACLIPAPCYLMEGGTSCIGTSSQNENGKVLTFLFEEFIEGVPLTDLIGEHRRSWQEDGVLHDKLRLELFNPLYQGVFWLHYFGVADMAISAHNVMMRTEGTLKGTIAFVGLCRGHIFTRSKQMRSQDSNAEPALLNRRCTSLMYQISGQGLKGRRLLRFARPNNAQVRSLRCITRNQIQEFLKEATKEGLGYLVAGTAGSSCLKEAKETIEKQEAVGMAQRMRIGSTGNPGHFDRELAFAADLLAVNKLLFGVLTLGKDETSSDWDARRQAAAARGENGIRAMLLTPLLAQVPQQPLAFERLVDLFVRGLGPLGPGERCDAEQTMTCAMNTLPILPAEDELELKQNGSIMLPRGVLNFPGQGQILCPAVSFAEQERQSDSCVTENAPGSKTKSKTGSKVRSSKGIGVRAEEMIRKGTILGAYAGFPGMNAEIGRPYLTLKYPSRYVAVVIGNIPELKKQSLVDKVSVDAQVTMIHDWRWVKISRNVGPYLNAPDANDPNDEVNCVLDRESLTKDDKGMYWMLIKTNKDVPKGTFLQWSYDPTAGPGGFWKFSQPDAAAIEQCQPGSAASAARRKDGAGSGRRGRRT